MELFLSLALASFLNGLTGSIHCAAMCGPLAGSLSLKFANSGKSKNRLLQLSYNLGRFFSYTSIGLALGFLGEVTNLSLSKLLPIQEIAAWIGALALLFFGIAYLFGKNVNFSPYFGKVVSKFLSPMLKNSEGKPSSNRNIAFLGFGFGLFTGLLPCGILYPVFIISYASGSPLVGAMIMAGFFLGTFPALFLVGMGFRSFASKLHPNRMRIVGGVILLLSLFMIFQRFHHIHHSEEGPEVDHSSMHHH
ncbi:sulfite exporter TauE/SafE family protein [Leptospira langatensis]|uniref:Sulfite exporter TauE/SafE family protein n=1 Tax=Leptospira langatensis TaxID=2484983 RepID=A0A5F1ZYP6_9LEPT|nr:sulfite exporter TauE/SafE family protein [Leptospira langatensis]TGJ98456.1 sulfite exporter TauE/SafE family protein [Leptospira langatensis]TGL43370.1 sulfite exporter TauE/SafE family protein [Leptospira langatensis]